MAPPQNKSLVIPIFVQLALAALGFWSLWGFPYRNGLLKFLGAQSEPGAVIPGPVAAPMRQHYTGIGPVDKQLTVLVSFFYTAIDGNRADISIAFLSLGSHVIASWVLITLEGIRPGNRGLRLLTSTTLLGLGVAILGFAVVAPLFFAYHLYASSTVHTPPAYNLVPQNPLAVALIPVGIMIGFGLPSLIMTFPAPSVLSFETKQLWTGIQQGWTIWILLATALLTIAVSFFNPDIYSESTTVTHTKSVKNMRRTYIFALASAASAHLLPLLICGMASLFPLLFNQPYNTQLQLGNVFSLTNPFSDLKAASLADGALWFLQWDTFVGVVSVFTWAFTLRAAGKREEATTAEWLVAAAKASAVTAAVGPTAYAVIAVWSRDEMELRLAEEGAKAEKKNY